MTIGGWTPRPRLRPVSVGVGLALVAVAGGGVATAVAWWAWSRPQPVLVPRANGPAAVAATPLVATSATSPAGMLVVDVEGSVARPGLVRLPPGSRVADALTAAGGLRPGTSDPGLNRARPLADGEQVLVGAPATPSGGGVASTGPLDLNSATLDQLDALPGVGPVMASRILAWRAEHGRFASVDELGEVPGIGDRKLADLRSRVRV